MADLDPVIKTIIAEALGEGSEGMRLVGETIINRAEQRGLTPADVVRQPYQYTGYSNPGPAAVKAFNDPSAITAAQAAWNLAKAAGDPTGGANHYYAQGTISQPGWAKGMTNTLTKGGHTFYTDKPGYQQKGLGPLAPANIAQVSPTTAALRQMTSPSMGNTELQNALNQYAANKATAMKNQVTPQIPPWASMNMNQGSGTVKSGALSPDQIAAANRAALMMNQSYVGQDSKGGYIGGGKGLSAAQQAAANRAALSMGGNFSYAGNQGTGNLANDRLPQGQAGLPANYGTFSPNQVNAMGAPVGGGPITTNPRTAPIPFTRPGSNVPMPIPRPGTGMTVPQPMPANMRPNGAPVPFPRPNFGMGGPGFAPVNAATMAQMQGNAAQPAPSPVAPPRPAVGTILGIAGNGGLQTQGYGGVNNSITQKNFAEAQGMQINPNGTMSLMAGGGPDYVNGVLRGGGNDRNPSASRALTPEQLAALQSNPASPYRR